MVPSDIGFPFRIELFLCLLPLFVAANASAQPAAESLVVSRVTVSPSIDDFMNMEPSSRVKDQLAKAGNFVQTTPKDGSAATQRTDVYTGYDYRNLYVIFVAWDSEPEKVRGTMSRRENIDDNDDWVEVAIDTFDDHRHAYLFDCNPLGVQWDALYQEDQGENANFDTLWYSHGRRTARGFVVWMAIPFKSLRFPDRDTHTWGIHFRRHISRIPELSCWPHISSRVRGRLNQAAALTGLADISPGRNSQLIPYANFRSFRALDERDPIKPYFREVRGELDAGLDAKFVLKDKLVIDATMNPDFSQVESDDPQVTVNQRFEVFFPEKRPFFMENATYFETPLNLVFTRRIADPQFGGRLTGKVGAWAIGALFMDDQAPGKEVLEGDPDYGRRAGFGIVRVSRDILNQSSLGAIYTDREYRGTYNRVGGADANFRLGRNWVTRLQGVTSWTQSSYGDQFRGPAYFALVERSGRQLNFQATYEDVGSDFVTQSGFVNRTDYRQVFENLTYRFRPEGKTLIAWGPDIMSSGLWDRTGRRLDSGFTPAINFELTGQTRLRFAYSTQRERIRPQDFPGLNGDRDFGRSSWGARISSSYLKHLSFNLSVIREHAVNIVPPSGTGPSLANRTQVAARINLRPVTPLRIVNDYIFYGLWDRASGATILNNHIARTNWNWQFNRRLSLRVILQYDAVLGNSAFTRLPTNKNFNADFLISYLINPGTAFFLGYNSNRQNIMLVEQGGRTVVVPSPDRFITDGRQLFFKLSYLFRF